MAGEHTREAPCAIYDDPREIAAIHWAGYDPPAFSVGRYGVTRIVAYKENGEYAYVPWLAVYQGDEISDRIPAGHMHVVYARAAISRATETGAEDDR